ncbi:hypothetical protein EST38_g2554 [Candolleomyces aberdarensis]|uniref:Major facilitator superfamily (MFS) profile domain-containing protein n=1 Tax=Candolleomyces aberdarensis TaxID=2316362 RepID=A0A4Q2DUB5_9AGAR|nr:hypothetical protein EST38_g2554 [Candolleomyces aberdarensis]
MHDPKSPADLEGQQAHDTKEKPGAVVSDEKVEIGSSGGGSPTPVSKDVDFEQEIDPVAEARLLRKLDWILLPMFTAIYCCNFIDRTNIGNARVAGLEADLGMEGADLNVALTVFYVCYILSDIPSNLLLKRFGSPWLAFLVVGFGLVSVCSAFLHNFSGLIATRVFLGLTEGGTLYYRRQELITRVGIFFGLVGGLLASGLLRLPDMGSVKTWRKIFLIEGVITTLFGIILFFILPDDPIKSRLLSPEERRMVIARKNRDDAHLAKDGAGGEPEKTTWKLVWRSFSFTTVACTLGFIMINMSFQGLSLFLPSVIRSLGRYSTVEIQLRTVPPYLASAVWAVANAFLSSRIRMRWLPLLYNTLFGVAGYAISVSTQNSQARYAACFLIIIAGGIVGPMLVIWGTDNAAPDTMRAVVSGAIPGIGAIGAVMAVWTYLPSDAPNYRKGNLGNLGTMSTLCVIICTMAVYIKLENAKRERGGRDYRLEGKTEEELRNLGYRHPEFRYQI